MSISPEDQQAIAALVVSGLREEGLQCNSFSAEERETLHTLHRARKEAGVEHSDLVTVFQWGRSLEGGFKKMISIFGITCLFIIFMLAMKMAGVFAILKVLVTNKVP